MLAALRRWVPFDAYAWLLTDPETSVGCAPLAEIPSLGQLPDLVRLKYLTPLHRWTTLDEGTAVSLHEATGGVLSRSLVWRELLHELEVVDVLSTVFRDQYGCWGFLDLWRSGRHVSPFGADELAAVRGVTAIVTAAVRGRQAEVLSAVTPVPAESPGPHVLLLSDDLRVQGQTTDTDDYLRLLLPQAAAHPPIPAQAYNVGAQLLAVEAGVDAHPPAARVHLAGGVWVTVRAARLAATGTPSSIAVDLEPTRPADRMSLFARAYGLTARESELLQLLASGDDTRALAQALFVSEHTVQDHLKSMFAKTGCHSRWTLLARATGSAINGR